MTFNENEFTKYDSGGENQYCLSLPTFLRDFMIALVFTSLSFLKVYVD